MNIALQCKSRPQAEAKLNDRWHRHHLVRVATSRAGKRQMEKHVHTGSVDRGKSPALRSSSRCPFAYSVPSSRRVPASALHDGISSELPSTLLLHSDKSLMLPSCSDLRNAPDRNGADRGVENGIARVGNVVCSCTSRVPLSTQVACAARLPSIACRWHPHCYSPPDLFGLRNFHSRRRHHVV